MAPHLERIERRRLEWTVVRTGTTGGSGRSGRSGAFDPDTSSVDVLGQGRPALLDVDPRTPSDPFGRRLPAQLGALIGGGRAASCTELDDPS